MQFLLQDNCNKNTGKEKQIFIEHLLIWRKHIIQHCHKSSEIVQVKKNVLEKYLHLIQDMYAKSKTSVVCAEKTKKICTPNGSPPRITYNRLFGSIADSLADRL